MNSLRQLLRQPVKSVAGILLLALSGSLLCASVGQYAAAVRTRRQVDEDYTLAALTTDKFKFEITDTGAHYYGQQPQKVQDFLSDVEANRPDLIRRVDRLGLISGYCPAITPLNYIQMPYHAISEDATGFTIIADCPPYTTAVLAVTLEEIGPVEEDTRFAYYTTLEDGTLKAITPPQYAVSLTGRIDQAVFLQEGYPDPAGRTLRFTLGWEDEEEFTALNLRAGERYLVFGANYYDLDWWMRREIVGLDLADSLEAVDWDQITLLEDIEDKELRDYFSRWGIVGQEKAAVYGELEYGSRKSYTMTQHEYDCVNASSLDVTLLTPALLYCYMWNPSGLTFGSSAELNAYMQSEEYQEAVRATNQEFNERYAEPSIVHLDGTVEEFLSSPDGALWTAAMEQADVSNHALPVLTTDRLESVVQFIRGDAVIAQGRSFTKEEYSAGARVCVLSETLAAANGLSVGDRIPLSLYAYDSNYEFPSNTANPTAARYSAAQGFAAPEEEYEIVGLYRQTNEWGMSAYDFLPNTVFVPAKAVTADTWTCDSGIFQTIVLRNGTQENMQALLKEAELEGLFAYYDQGYANIADELNAYVKNVQISLIAGVGAWVVIFLLFLFLFPFSQRKSARRMWALGATAEQIRRHVLVSGAGLAAPGTILGGALGYVFLQGALKRAAAETGLAIGLEPWVVLMLAGIQVVCCLAASFLCGAALAGAERKRGVS